MLAGCFRASLCSSNRLHHVLKIGLVVFEICDAGDELAVAYIGFFDLDLKSTMLVRAFGHASFHMRAFSVPSQ